MSLRIERLARNHDRVGFTCGEASLDEYLQRHARHNQALGVSTTHVLVDAAAPRRILAYMCMATAQIALDELNPDDRARLPRYPVPAARLTRLAVAESEQGRGHGSLLLGEAVNRCRAVREVMGIRVLVVDALHDKAAVFYEKFGFRRTDKVALTLYLPLGA